MKLYRIIKSILLLVLLIIVGVCAYNFIDYKKTSDIPQEIHYKNNETDIDLEKKLLEEKIDTSQKFISEVEKLDTIYFAKRNGEITLSHDRTPEDNSLTEWITNSEIEVTTSYEALYGLETKYISYNVNEDGNLDITYNEHFFDVKSLDLTSINFVEDTSFLGKKYTKADLLAIRKLSKEKIKTILLKDENMPLLNENITEYFSNEARAFGLDKIVINGIEITL